jgi:cellulose synthase/poly-beta-1,6-N-acetylglucosamine synthase-like glycosyltransferase
VTVPAALTMPFEGLAPIWQTILYAELILILAMFSWTFLLFVRGQRARRAAPAANQALADELTWVFMVPALNEAVTIRDSVERLMQTKVKNRHIVVIDDGSDDGTPDVLASIEHPDLWVLRREPPEAREGKATALNWAWRQLDELNPEIARDKIIVVIVDADGRLHPDSPSFAAAHFADPQVGGVQSLVRIYNRDRILTWFQDVEFGVYGNLFQAGRNDWGTAGMGGNGQFNRLSALDSVANHEGPWRESLTEDQDLGLRLIVQGWLGRQDLRATVDQQGLPNFRKLLRQRTRWSQGNLQALSLFGTIGKAPRPLVARIEARAYLLMPFWQMIIGAALVASLYLLLSGQAVIWNGDTISTLIFFYILGFGGTVMGCIASRAADGFTGVLRGFLIGQAYAFYSWIIWPVLARSTFRQITERRDWAKTDRVPLAEADATEPESALDRENAA